MDDNAKIITVIGVVFVLLLAAVGIGIATSNSAATYTVTYDYNYDGAPDAVKKSYERDSLIYGSGTPQVRLNEGWYYAGWYEDKNCTEPVNFPYKVTKNVTFYCKWSDEIMSKYYNSEYLTNTVSGKAFAQFIKSTTGATDLKIDGKVFNGEIVGVAKTFAIVDCNDGEYTVVDLVEMKSLFKIQKALSVKCFSLSESLTEFFCAQYNDGFYMYDLTGKSYGPATDVPTAVLANTILFGDNFYRFNEDGSLYKAFAKDSSTHIPNGGNGKIYYELVTQQQGDDKYGTAANILNSEFKVIRSIEFPAPCKYYSCTSNPGGSIVVQYAYEVGPQDLCSFVEQISDKKYSMKTFAVDEKKMDEMTMHNVIYRSIDRLNSPEIDWDWFTLGTFSFVQMGIVHHLTLADKTVYAKLSMDGDLFTVMNELNIGHIGAALETRPVGDGTHIMMYVKDQVGSVKYNEYDIVDGTGKKFSIDLDKVLNTDSAKYFVRDNSNLTEKDYNIYSVDGEKVGSYDGSLTVLGASHNLVFFKDGQDVYVFDGSQETPKKLFTYTGDKLKMTIGLNWYSYYDGSKYVVCAENGTQICTSTTGSIAAYETVEGKTIIDVKTTDTEHKVFVLTTS